MSDYMAKPKIVASISDKEVDDSSTEILSLADVIELRVDLFTETDHDAIKETFSKASRIFNRPLLGTVRDPSEGGNRFFPDRQAIYELISNYCDYIDIELAFAPMIRALKDKGGRSPLIIGSYHNFKGTPDEEVLHQLLKHALYLSVDITKISVMAECYEDLLRLLIFASKYRSQNIIVISMGERGFASRIIGGLFGSMMTYGHIGNSAAPGQAHIKELKEMIDRLFPPYRQQ